MRSRPLLVAITILASSHARCGYQDMQALAASNDVLAESAVTKIRSSYQKCIDQSLAATPLLLRCSSDELVYQEARLDSVYKRLGSSLDDDGKQALHTEEQRWTKDKDRHCSAGDEAAQGDLVAAADCEVGETARRATELEGRVKK